MINPYWDELSKKIITSYEVATDNACHLLEIWETGKNRFSENQNRMLKHSFEEQLNVGISQRLGHDFMAAAQHDSLLTNEAILRSLYRHNAGELQATLEDYVRIDTAENLPFQSKVLVAFNNGPQIHNNIIPFSGEAMYPLEDCRYLNASYDLINSIYDILPPKDAAGYEMIAALNVAADLYEFMNDRHRLTEHYVCSRQLRAPRQIFNAGDIREHGLEVTAHPNIEGKRFLSRALQEAAQRLPLSEAEPFYFPSMN
jgi:hypothetical protein